MALWTHSWPSGSLKKDIGEVDEAKLKGVQRPYQLIFCILRIKKWEFIEAA
jgi:hypothetical protein